MKSITNKTAILYLLAICLTCKSSAAYANAKKQTVSGIYNIVDTAKIECLNNSTRIY
ncbi:hypothetical protein JCM30760_14820 [Thiomicrorhabdus hydrogeniphila]